MRLLTFFTAALLAAVCGLGAPAGAQQVDGAKTILKPGDWRVEVLPRCPVTMVDG